jgi:hypothetical protein
VLPKEPLLFPQLAPAAQSLEAWEAELGAAPYVPQQPRLRLRPMTWRSRWVELLREEMQAVSDEWTLVPDPRRRIHDLRHTAATGLQGRLLMGKELGTMAHRVVPLFTALCQVVALEAAGSNPVSHPRRFPWARTTRPDRSSARPAGGRSPRPAGSGRGGRCAPPATTASSARSASTATTASGALARACGPGCGPGAGAERAAAYPPSRDSRYSSHRAITSRLGPLPPT